MSMLSIRNYQKYYNEDLVLSIESVDFEPGIHWIKGENGAGKSTFLKSVAGMIPFNGKIKLNEKSITGDPVMYRLMVNFSEAEPLFPGFLTPKDLVAFIGKAKKASKDQMDYYAQQFGIHAYFEKPCETFSSGMLKKLSLTLAFLGHPRLIILDEPLITLDLVSRQKLMSLVEDQLRKDTLFLISSHQNLGESELKVQSTLVISNKTLSIA
jgi:ABC-2 type transport system ATP-binding protein